MFSIVVHRLYDRICKADSHDFCPMARDKLLWPCRRKHIDPLPTISCRQQSKRRAFSDSTEYSKLSYSFSNQIPQDQLERCTTDIYDNEKRVQLLNRDELEQLIESEFIRLAPDLCEILFNEDPQPSAAPFPVLTLDNIRDNGSKIIGYDLLKFPIFSDNTVFCFSTDL